MIYGFYLREVVNHLNPFCSDLRVNRLFGLHPELLYDRNKYYQRMDILDYSLLPFELYFGCQFLLVLTLPWLSIAQGRRKWVEMGRWVSSFILLEYLKLLEVTQAFFRFTRQFKESRVRKKASRVFGFFGSKKSRVKCLFFGTLLETFLTIYSRILPPQVLYDSTAFK